MKDELLLRHYLSLNDPEAAGWNLSPECLYSEWAPRDHLRRNVTPREDWEVCNVGVGAGAWDDWLGFWLPRTAKLTSIDLDQGCCDVFSYRQERERHPNPSRVLCRDILSDLTDLAARFDLVTIIGSTVQETGAYEETLCAGFTLLRAGGCLFYMDFARFHRLDAFTALAARGGHRITSEAEFDHYPESAFYLVTAEK